MFVGLRAAFVALAGMALVAASSNAVPGGAVPIAAPSAPQPDRGYAFMLDGNQPSPSRAVDAQLSYDFSSQLDDVSEGPAPAPVAGGSLKALVNATGTSAEMDTQLRCLATAVYFEAKGEPLEGQLAVAQVILNRVESGRFASSICGVVNQPNQFSFAKGVSIPTASGNWRTAVAIARIARDERWQQIAPDALFFHARYVAPSWRQNREKISQVGAHIFYR